MAYVETWSESVPAGSEARSLGDDRIRAFKYAIRERLASDHEFYADESGHSYVGYHGMIHLTQQSSPTATTDIGHLYVKNVSGTTELFFTDEAGNEKQLTSAGALNISATEAVLLTGAQTVAGVKTFSSSPIVPTPTTDMQAATKKYIDDINTTLTAVDAARLISAIKNYSTSGTTATDVDQDDLKIAFGARTVGAGSSATVTGLPFTSTTSYFVIISLNSSSDTGQGPNTVVINSASQITIYNRDVASRSIFWLAIGS